MWHTNGRSERGVVYCPIIVPSYCTREGDAGGRGGCKDGGFVHSSLEVNEYLVKAKQGCYFRHSLCIYPFVYMAFPPPRRYHRLRIRRSDDRSQGSISVSLLSVCMPYYYNNLTTIWAMQAGRKKRNHIQEYKIKIHYEHQAVGRVGCCWGRGRGCCGVKHTIIYPTVCIML